MYEGRLMKFSQGRRSNSFRERRCDATSLACCSLRLGSRAVRLQLSYVCTCSFANRNPRKAMSAKYIYCCLSNGLCSIGLKIRVRSAPSINDLGYTVVSHGFFLSTSFFISVAVYSIVYIFHIVVLV